MRSGRILLEIVILAGLAVSAGAEGLPESSYRFTAGDVVEIAVTPQKGFDRTVTIQPDGKFSYPLVGQAQAAGLTVAEVAEQLRMALAKELKEPSVTLSLKERSKQSIPRVSLLGAVRSPGVFEIRETTTVAELLALGGGPTRTADTSRVTVTRPDQTVFTLDLSRTEETGRIPRAVTLQAGDLIVVPEGEPPTVLVVGEVVRPGVFELQFQTRLMDVLAQAGGATEVGDLRRVTLTRRGSPQPQSFDLEKLFSSGDAEHSDQNLVLQPGDTVTVPRSERRYFVAGRVAKPSAYPMGPNDRVLDALVAAGGAAADGDITRAILLRQTTGGPPTSQELDLKKMMSRSDMAGNELLRPGDVLFIPDKKNRRPSGEITGLLWSVTSLFNILR